MRRAFVSAAEHEVVQRSAIDLAQDPGMGSRSNGPLARNLRVEGRTERGIRVSPGSRRRSLERRFRCRRAAARVNRPAAHLRRIVFPAAAVHTWSGRLRRPVPRSRRQGRRVAASASRRSPAPPA